MIRTPGARPWGGVMPGTPQRGTVCAGMRRDDRPPDDRPARGPADKRPPGHPRRPLPDPTEPPDVPPVEPALTDGDTPTFVGHCRRPAAIVAVVVLLVCFPVALPLAAFCAVALLATPRSGHLGRRHTDPRHLAGTWGADRSTADTTSADDGPCCPAGNPTATPSSKGQSK